MSTFAQTTQGDLAFTVGATGLKNFSLIVDRATACAQKLQNRFALALGEWFLNVLIGVPYFQVVLVKNPDIGAIRSLFRSIILGTPPVQSLTDLSLNYSPTTRNLSYSFEGVTDDGAVIEGGSGQPFIVTRPAS